MGGSSKSSTGSTTSTSLKPISLSNNFYTAKVKKNGKVTTGLKSGTAGKTTYDFVNSNISGLLDNYLNPSLDDPTTQAKLQQFNKTQQQNLQNNILSPLANNNMIRSSQATNMYNNLSNQSADYANDLIANSQANTKDMIETLYNLYSGVYQGMANDQATAVNAAIGAGEKKTNSSSKAK